MRMPLITRFTNAYRALMNRPDAANYPFLGQQSQPNPFANELRAQPYAYSPYINAQDLDNFAGENNEMRAHYLNLHAKEPSVRTAIEGKVAAIASLDVAVLPEDKDNPKDCRAAEFVKWTISNTPHGWDGLASKVAKPSLLLGHSVTDIVMAPVEYHAKWGGLWGVRACMSKDPTNISLQIDEYREVRQVVSRVRGIEYHDPRKFILFSNAALFENPFGQSDMRAAYRSCVLIDDAYKLWSVAIKVYSAPIVHGKYAKAENRTLLERAMQGLRSGGWLSSHKDDDIQILNMANAVNFQAFESKINKLREEIFLVIRGSYLPFLEGSGGNNTGNTVVSKNVSNDSEYLLAKAVARALTSQLVPAIVIPNFGPDVGMPKIVLGGTNWGETGQQLDVAKRVYADFKLPLSKKYIYEISQMPPPSDDDDAINPPAEQQPQPPGMGGAATGQQPGGDQPAGDGSDGGNPMFNKGVQKFAEADARAEISSSTKPRVPPRGDDGDPPFVTPAAPTQTLPTSMIHTDPERFQWRENTDPITGIEGSRRNERFAVASMKPLDVWLDPDDRRVYVIDGHHRLASAKRDGIAQLPVNYLDAPDAMAAREFGRVKQFAAGVASSTAPPGPPPRPNLKWKPSTHRWVNPATGEEHEHGSTTPTAKSPKPTPPAKPLSPSKVQKAKTTQKTPSKQAESAKKAHVMVGRDIQRYAEEHNEPKIALALKGVSLPNGEPVDVMVPGKDGKVAHGIELKTSVVGANRQVDMNPYAKVRKIIWEKAQGATFHTVVLDDHDVFNANGPGNHDESKRRIFYRRGVGGSKFSIDAMHEVKDLAELKKVMNMPEADLPDAAKRTDAALRVGTWKPFQDENGKGFTNAKTGQTVRAKK